MRAQGSPSPRRIALLVEYDGTAYHGFQIQRRGDTVQARLQEALLRLTGEAVKVRGASRTDSGAHALGQVVAFDTTAPYEAEVFARALNAYLPPDIRVLRAVEAPPGFHPRRDATARVYRYVILNRPVPPAVGRLYAHWEPQPLDETAMDRAGRALEGTHNFRAFSGTLPAGRSYVRRVESWRTWRRGACVIIEARANAFLPYQVRRTARVLVEVGKGALPPSAVEEALRGERSFVRLAPLPAKGLFLVRVEYPQPLFGREEENEPDAEHILPQGVGVETALARD